MSLINGTNQNDTLLGTAEDDEIFGANGDDSLDGLGGNDRLDGGNGNDTLQGGDGNDTLKGGNGNDRLYAGKGQDLLTGNNGDDIFVISRNTGSSTLAEADSITDFGRGKDLIELTNGLTFNNLNVSQGTEAFARDTVINDKLTGQVLGVLQGVNSSTIDSTDFISDPAPVKGYTFTKIADTSGLLSSFDAYPAINDSGTVVFQARLDDGSYGIFTGSGGATTTIADTNGRFSGFPGGGDPEINNQGTVVFNASLDEGEVGVFSNSGGETTTIVSGQDYAFQDVDINNLGTVAFSGALQPGGVTSLYFTNNGVTTKIAGPSGPISSIEGSEFQIIYNVDINESDDVIFRAATSNSTIGTFTINNGVASLITDINGGGIAINDEGTVVFDNGGNNILKNSNGVTTSLVDTSGSFNSVQSPVINNNGTVVFAAPLDEDAGTYNYGIYTGPDPINDKVIASGDTLDGSTVQSPGAILSDNGLNNLDQIAFTVRFTDGTEAIYRADPITLGQGVGASGDPFGIDTNMYNNAIMQDLNTPIIPNSLGMI